MINIYAAQGYCKDEISLIENYDKAIADTTQVWHCHHKDEIDLNLTRKELIAKKLYYGVPANKLIFLTRGEHTRLHWTGRRHSKETRGKISDTRLKNGCAIKEKNGMFGKHHSKESKKRMSEARKGVIPWNKGKHPKRKPHSEETKKRMSEARKAYWERKRNANK